MALTAAEERIASVYPKLFHMAAYGSWPSIVRHGLLSTRHLVDLYGLEGDRRRELLSVHRPESVELRNEQLGRAIIRDQKPMSDSGLSRSLLDGITPAQWYEKLNEMVFLWVDEARLNTLMNARAYRKSPHTVLVLDTAKTLAVCGINVLLSPINSGATKPFAWPRGKDTFTQLEDYPFDDWRRKRSCRDAVVEFAVKGKIPGVLPLTLEAYHQYPEGRREYLK
jgi:hypothetical protein